MTRMHFRELLDSVVIGLLLITTGLSAYAAVAIPNAADSIIQSNTSAPIIRVGYKPGYNYPLPSYPSGYNIPILPDLIITNVTCTQRSQILPGKNVINCAATIANQGNGAVVSNARIDVSMNADRATQEYTAFISGATKHTINGLTPNASYTQTEFGGYIYSDNVSRDFILRFIVDDPNRIAESNETNNSTNIHIVIVNGQLISATTSMTNEQRASSSIAPSITTVPTPTNTSAASSRNAAQASSTPTPLVQRLKGRILLQVQEHGEAWYVAPGTDKRYYLKDGTAAYAALRTFGLGITNADLSQIPVAGTSVTPNTPNTKFAQRLNGHILLQVQEHGEAWYVLNGVRYYLKDGTTAYTIMRELSLGITNGDLTKIPTGILP